MFQNIYIEHSEDGQTVHLWDDKSGYRHFSLRDFHYAYKLDPAGKFTSLHGQRLKQINRWSNTDANLFEADLPRETRVLTDLYLDTDEPSQGHRIVMLDIEVSSKGGFADVTTADKEITAIAITDHTTGEEYVFILDEDDRLADYTDETITVLPCYSEEDLLSSFLDKWEELNPTIVSGWNIDYFDIPYLYRRLVTVLGDEEAARLSRIGLIKFSEMRQQFVIAGISCLDYLDLYRKFTYTQQPNYRLDTIAQAELGEGKTHFEGTLDELYQNDLKTYVEYNSNDARLVSKLDKKLKLIELVRGICSIGHVPYEDYGFSSRWLEGALITDLHRKGIIAPNKAADAKQQMENREETGEEGFSGAYVKAPTPGLYHWVYSLDLQSLYPSIIMTLNISPETKVGKVKNWNVEQHIRKQITEYEVMDGGKSVKMAYDEFMSFMEEGKFHLSSNGILYRSDKQGLLAEVLDRWFKQRLDFKKKMKDAIKANDKVNTEYWDRRQHIQKIFLNSLYGVLGLPVFRFYDVDNALAVTATGQDVIKTSARFVNAKYAKMTKESKDYCIYIDTDSLYFSSLDYYTEAQADPQQTTITLAREVEKELNEFYPRLAKQLFFVREGQRFVIKGETIAQSAIWVQKKRYALKKVYDLDTNQTIDKMTVKGLDVVRSSFPAAFRKFMKEVLTDILDAKSKAHLDEKVLAFHAKLSSSPITDIARNTAVKDIDKWTDANMVLGVFRSSTPAHVKAAITHNLLLEHFNIHHVYRPITNGAKIKYVYLKQNPLNVEQVAFVGDDSDAPPIVQLIKEYIDYDKLFELEFSNKLQDFYTALKWGKIPTEVNQKASEFFTF